MDLISLEPDNGSPVTLSMLDQFEPLELIWEKGPVEEPLWGPPASTVTSQLAVQLSAPTKEILIGEDEMTAWLHYPIDTTDTRADLNRQTVAGTGNLPVLPGKAAESDRQVVQPVLPGKGANSDCQLGPLEKSTSKEKAGALNLGGVNNEGKIKGGFEGHCELIKQDSLIESKSSTIGSDEKRKDVPLPSTYSRKSRTTEVHNLSEQRRRSKINDKMKTLQGLVPRSNKLDKASILDATIAYVKSLQKQIKMFSRRCPMRPPMFPCGPPYMQSMPSIGIGMGMGTNMNVGMNMAMCMQPGMAPFGSAIPYLHINQTMQAPMLQMPHQHATEMFPYSHAGDPYHFASIAPGRLSPQHSTANKMMEKRKQAESSNDSS